MFFTAMSCSLVATLLRCFIHILRMYIESGNFVYFVKYVFSMAVVSCVSLNVLDACPL